MTNFKAILEEHSCKRDHGCGVATICMCSLAEDIAERVEQLEAALQWVIDADPVFMRSADQHPTYCKCHRCAMDNARAALEGKDESR